MTLNIDYDAESTWTFDPWGLEHGQGKTTYWALMWYILFEILLGFQHFKSK